MEKPKHTYYVLKEQGGNYLYVTPKNRVMTLTPNLYCAHVFGERDQKHIEKIKDNPRLARFNFQYVPIQILELNEGENN